jgi:hypothetical protein
MRTLAVMLVLSVSLSVSGCFLNNASPTRKISDVVHDMNDQARWGRMGDAAQYVDPTYRGTYLANHRHWGSAVQLADAEVVHVQIASDASNATAFVTYSWYSTDDMTLHQSVVRQRWNSVEENFVLFSETVVQGDPLLLRADGPGEVNNESASVSLLKE